MDRVLLGQRSQLLSCPQVTLLATETIGPGPGAAPHVRRRCLDLIQCEAPRLFLVVESIDPDAIVGWKPYLCKREAEGALSRKLRAPLLPASVAAVLRFHPIAQDPVAVRTDRRYTGAHDWAQREGPLVRVGITPFALASLQTLDVLHFEVQAGDHVKVGEVYGFASQDEGGGDKLHEVLELQAPLGGRVVQVHRDLSRNPGPLAADAYGQGWLLAVQPDEPGAFQRLLPAQRYQRLLRTAPPL